MPPDAAKSPLISSHELKLYIPYSSQQLRRLEAAGKFPRRVRLGPNRIGWVRQEIEQWLATRMGER